jgi:hypothetical protein
MKYILSIYTGFMLTLSRVYLGFILSVPAAAEQPISYRAGYRSAETEPPTPVVIASRGKQSRAKRFSQ